MKNKDFEKNESFEKIAISKDMKNWDIWNIEYFRKQIPGCVNIECFKTKANSNACEDWIFQN